nr:PREDICTED: cytochrome P450 26B1-like [Opisthocomus hoazin]
MVSKILLRVPVRNRFAAAGFVPHLSVRTRVLPPRQPRPSDQHCVPPPGALRCPLPAVSNTKRMSNKYKPNGTCKNNILARVFSRAALESYLPRIQKVVSWELRGWCMEPGSIAVYSSAKTLTFRIAARILLGLRLEEKQSQDLAKTFEQLVENLFSLPLNIPFSGLRKGIKARDMLHEFMEKAIQEKLQRNSPEDHSDALDFIINSAKEHGKEFTMQELKESAIELIFAAFFTTASASTSLILLLLKHPAVIEKIRQELVSQELYQQCECCPAGPCLDTLATQRRDSEKTLLCPMAKDAREDQRQPPSPAEEGSPQPRAPPEGPAGAAPSLRRLQDSSADFRAGLLVYPEVKRLMFRIAMRILLGFQPRQASPDGEQQLVEAFEEMIRNLFSLPIDVPFSGLYRGLRARNIIHAKIEENIRAKMARKEPEGGYKDALQLLMEHTQGNGEQLNMQELKESATELLFGGHETTEFNPDRFMSPSPEDSSRFSFIPFGGGLRSCVGKEFAKVLLKIFTVELARSCDWQLLNGPPTMKTGPIVYPVDNLPTKFIGFSGQI